MSARTPRDEVLERAFGGAIEKYGASKVLTEHANEVLADIHRLAWERELCPVCLEPAGDWEVEFYQDPGEDTATLRFCSSRHRWQMLQTLIRAAEVLGW